MRRIDYPTRAYLTDREIELCQKLISLLGDEDLGMSIPEIWRATNGDQFVTCKLGHSPMHSGSLVIFQCIAQRIKIWDTENSPDWDWMTSHEFNLLNVQSSWAVLHMDSVEAYLRGTKE